MSIITGIPRRGLTLESGRLAALRAELRDDPETASDPALQEMARVLGRPAHELMVSISGSDGETRLAFAIEGPTAVVTMARPGATAELAVVTADSIPGIIALAAELGPAPFIDEPDILVDLGELEGYLAGPRPPRSERSGETGSRAASVFAEPGVRNWSAYLAGVGDGEGERLLLDVVGGAGIGWWVLDVGESGARLIRTRAALIWETLCRLAAGGGVDAVNPEAEAESETPA